MLHIIMIGIPGILLLILSGLLLGKTLQLCYGRTCPACMLEALEQTTQATRSSQTTRDLDCATRERERERNKVSLAADIPPSRVSTEQAYKPCIVWGPGSVLTALGQQEVPQLLLWFITQVQQSFSTSFFNKDR